MSMLAEKKKKKKWFITPTLKPLWNTDSSGIKFGKGLMEKMGWSVGEGLGLNKQGIQEPLKVSYKSDTKGMGYKEDDDEWIEHQDEFNSFLNQLRNSDESFVVKTSDFKKDEVKSLEEKSKLSKVRLHYQKFTRGKDLSKYSENDLACILGTNKAKKEKSTTNEVVQEGPKTNDNFDTHFGVKTINSGSIKDYFKKGWISHKKLTDTYDAVDEETQNYQSGNFYSSTQEEENIKEKDKKRAKRKKLELNSDGFVKIETTMSLESNELEQIENKKKKKREKDSHLEEEPVIKKRKRNYDFEVDCDSIGKEKESIDVFVAQNNGDCSLENTNNNIINILKVDNINVKNELKNQKKRKKEEGDTSGILVDIKELFSKENSSEKENNVFEEELISKKKKKKFKKEKNFENYDKVESDASDSTLNNQKSFVKKEFKLRVEYYNDQRVNSGLDEDNFENTSETGIEKKKKKKNKKEKLIEAEEIDPLKKVKSSLKKEVTKDKSEIESDLELYVKKRKKRDKKEKSIEKEIGDNINEVEVIPEVELTEKKKKKDKRGKSNEKESDKKTEEVKDTSGVEFVEKEKKKNKEEKLAEKKIDINSNEVKVTPEIELVVKKRKKRHKREKFNENEIDENSNKIENTSEVEFVKKEKKRKRGKKRKSNEKESDKQTNEVEVISEVEFVKKKKKKKKSKKENSIEGEVIESLTNDGNYINNPSVEGNKTKKEIQDTPEIEFFRTKKMKKSKKEKSLKTEYSSIEITDELEIKEENCKITYERKPSPVVELFKKKIRKEKEKIIKEEEIELLDNCTNSIKPRSEEDKNEVEDIALASKKKKKKDKIKEILNEPNSKSFLQIEKRTCEIEEKNTQGAELLKEKKTSYGFRNHQNNDTSNNFSYSYNCHKSKGNLIKNRADAENGIQNPMKEEFLNDKRADKFYPGRDKTQKVLRLLYLSDFNEFKGSNVKKLVGYGIQINQR